MLAKIDKKRGFFNKKMYIVLNFSKTVILLFLSINMRNQ